MEGNTIYVVTVQNDGFRSWKIEVDPDTRFLDIAHDFGESHPDYIGRILVTYGQNSVQCYYHGNEFCTLEGAIHTAHHIAAREDLDVKICCFTVLEIIKNSVYDIFITDTDLKGEST